MSWNARTCRGCGLRFEPARLDAKICPSCEAVSGELLPLVEYLRSHPEEPITRVAAATGIGEDLIRDWAREGRLPHIPAGAEPQAEECTCEPNAKGRCQVCRAQLSKKLAGAARMLQTPLVQPNPRANAGMRTRTR